VKRLTVLVLLMAAAAHAQEPISFTGFVDAAYIWNRNRPSNHENFIPGTGTTGKRGNELSLNLAQLQWSRATSEKEPIGFTFSPDTAGDVSM